MMSIIGFLFGRPEKSASIAKERLQIVLGA